MAVAAALLIAPSLHHRILFRQHQKPYLVAVGTGLMIVAMMFLTVGLTGILILISQVVFGNLTARIVGAVGAVVIGWLWFGMPLRHRRHLQRFQ